MNLYEIKEAYMKLQMLLEDPEVDQQLVEDTIKDMDEELEFKADGYVRVIRNLEGNADALDKEIKRLQAKKKACQNGIDKLKNNLQEAMITLKKPKIQTGLFTITIQKNGGALPVVVDVPTEELPDECVIVKETPNLTTIAKLLGNDPDKYGKFAHFGDRGESLRIK